MGISITCNSEDNFNDCQWDFLGGSMIKSLHVNAGNAGELDFIPGSGRSLGEESGYSLQYFCLGNPLDRGAWRATAQGVAKVPN